jgi:hypothetical protein
MAKLITTQNAIADADTADLVYTYNTLEGKSIKKFETRETAERRVAMAILAAENRAGHKGVKPNEAPKAIDGLTSKAKEPQSVATKPTDAPKAPAGKNAKASKVKAPKAPKEPKAPAATKVLTITAAGSVECGVRAGTFRGQILQSIREAGDAGMAKDTVVALHGKYTADVVCKFKRLGFITESKA